MSMPDTWEFPWYASWDLAFHCIPFALVDPHFAKGQIDVIVREWYQHPNGHVPAYEWNFSDVNPPVLGWAAWRVYQIERKQTGKGDRAFLETIFHKLLLAFHLVGESERFERQKYFRRRVPRPRQHRGIRSQRFVS